MGLLALAGALVLTGLAAALPAIRAGFLKPIVVLTTATAPRGASGRFLRLAANRLRLPQPIVLGVGEAFARPLRSGLTVLAILLGAATVAVAIGMPRSFQKINDSETSAGNMQVIVTRNDGFPDSDVMRILTAQPETTRVVGLSGVNIDVPGISNPVNTRVFRGDSWHLGYLLVAGRWFDGPGEVLAEKALPGDATPPTGNTLKAVGMSPRQVLVMVAASAGLLAVIGGLLATPLGVVLNRLLLDVVNSSAGNDTPPSGYAALNPTELAGILLMVVTVAVAAALIPARWAARTNVVEVLHSE